MGYGTPIRILHSLLALSMLTQLAVGELMDVPEVEDEHEAAMNWIMPAIAHEGEHHAAAAGPVVETLGFEVHEFLGLFIGGLLLARIILALTSVPGAGFRDLLPWLFADGRKKLGEEIKAQMAGWKQAKLAPPEEGETVARMVHGLILLASIAMAITGSILFFGWSQTTPQTEFIEFIAETHELVVGGLEALIGAHILAVIIHQRMGHNIIARIKPGA
ncbi:cytochrome b/b6 domain-containing protein [Mariprofundus erugo]|uniref:Cytochrome b/b6 domain-containing protein n=1 Tax=Mariprofundus erugo TaxID=2528639 RepID=A0A5R9GV39_9PROT|nr:cytochrome b/b6 domain-containing protein [Mariprofundus erugo]TLS67034.1 cytochrome b/b6 domain-containing protein [Mariprofundus erugo]